MKPRRRRVVMSQGENSTTSELFQQWQASCEDKIINNHSQEEPNTMQPEQHSSEAQRIPFQYSQPHYLQPKQIQDHHQQQKVAQISQQQQVAQVSHQFSQPAGMQISENPISNREQEVALHYLRLQMMNNQPVATTGQASGQANRPKQLPFGLLLPVIIPQLDKDRAAQLHTLYNKVKKNEIPKEGFVRHMKSIVEDQMLKLAVVKVQNFPSTAFPIYGSNSGTYYGTNANSSMSSLKPQGLDSQLRQVSRQQNMGTTQAMNMTRMHAGSFPQVKNNSTSSSGSYVKQAPADQATEHQHKSQLSTPHGMSSISTMKVEQGNTIAGALMEEFTERQSGRVSIPSALNMTNSNSISSSMTTHVDANVSE